MLVLGIILGITTTFPELILGINATVKGVANISAGNLLGGIMVLFGLILGGSLILNRGIKTDGQTLSLLPQILFIFLPLFLGLDGQFSVFDGGLILGAYILLLVYLYYRNQELKKKNEFSLIKIKGRENMRSIFIIIISIIILIISSNFIIKISGQLLQQININPFIIGLLLFSIGTNLPEITITLTSWWKKSADLSLSYVIGSAMANIMVLGLLSIIKPINIFPDLSYMLLIVFITFTLSILLIFYKSGKILSKIEGIFLILTYILFVYLNILIS